GIVADGHVQEIAQLAEVGDAVHLGAYGSRRLALEVAAVENVLVSRGVQLEAESDVEEGADASFDEPVAARGRVNSGKELQERAFAGAVVAEDADALAGADRQVHVPQRLDLHERVDRAPEHLADQEL